MAGAAGLSMLAFPFSRLNACGSGAPIKGWNKEDEMTATTVGMGAVQRRSLRDLYVISTGHALTHWSPATFYLLLPLIGKELGLNYGEIGSILTCQYAAGAIANVPGGIFVDTVGRKGLLMSFHGMGGNVGDAVAPLVIGLLLQSFNWRSVVFMNVVPGIVVAVI